MTIREHTLERHGVEPVRETTTRLRPRNGPFHPPAARAPEPVRTLNHASSAAISKD